MLNDDTANLKSHLKELRANLAQTGNVDEELQSLLQQLDGDIRSLLERRTAEATEETDPYGLSERTQELTARFAVEHPRLELSLARAGKDAGQYGHLRLPVFVAQTSQVIDS
ncbi:DUF4404 family protein [Massilia sp. B-10]|nr:DUF4404 family protein [Massilia sp. B-10]